MKSSNFSQIVRLLCCGALLVSAKAEAAGFAVGTQGAHSLGLAGAATARLDSPDAGYFNPAAWTYGEGLKINVGAALILPTIQHTHPETGVVSHAEAGGTPPYAHLAYNFGNLAIGAAFFAPFGSGLTWPGEDWAGRYEIRTIGLTTFELAPVLAYRFLDIFSVAAGPRILWASVQLARNLDVLNPQQDGLIELGGHGRGLGFQAALAAGPVGPLSFGLTYRSRTHIGFEGAASFQNVPVEQAHIMRDGDVTTAVTLPDRIALGAALELQSWQISVDVEYHTWRTFRSLDINFVNEDTPDSSEPRNWHDTVAVRAGVQYNDLLPGLQLRLGAAYDPTPSPSNTLSPSLPDSDRLLGTVGASYYFFDAFAVHAAYGFLYSLPTESTGDAFPGRYRATSHLASVGASLQW